MKKLNKKAILTITGIALPLGAAAMPALSLTGMTAV